MKKHSLALTMVLLTPFTASVLELKTSAAKTHSACEGRMRCSQLLSPKA